MQLRPSHVARGLAGASIVILGAIPAPALAAGESAVVASEFIFESAPFPECHASTIVESGGTLVCAWFGGTREKHRDVGIWLSRHEGGKWTAPIEIADGVQPDGVRLPCWNPVLFQPRRGPLLLFYKVGPSPDAWWGLMRTSADSGRTWSTARRLPDGILGPIKNKPVELDDGTLVCGSSTEPDGWKVHFERTADGGRTWEKTVDLNDGRAVGAIQPALCRDGRSITAWCRTEQDRVYVTRSTDAGKTWSALEPTVLPNPNSGVDATRLADGRCLLVYNHTRRGRSPLNIAVTRNGRDWEAGQVLESGRGEFSYPAVIQTRDGLVHVTYTWKRTRVRHVVIDPARLAARPIVDGTWPAD